MWTLLVGAALAGRWDGVEGDIEASREIPAAPEQVFAYVLDLKHLQEIFPTDCVGSWELSDRTYGEGATAYVRYDMAAMHRELPMTLVRAEAVRYIDFDHVGPKGFLTRWHFQAADGGTSVKIETPLKPPPWPFRGYFHTVVQPEWKACYQRTLDNLATQMAHRTGGTAPASETAPEATPAPESTGTP